MDNLIAVAQQFTTRGRVLDIREYGSGNVNDTFLVTVGSAHPTLSPDSPEEQHFILQRLNPQVFRRPELVMGNLSTFTEHVRQRLERAPLSPPRRWEVPRVLPARDGQDHFLDPGRSFWRALSFIEAAETFDTIQDLEHAREVGYALGMFHHLLSDLPADRLADTLPGFHITPIYLSHYDEVLAITQIHFGRGGQGPTAHLQSSPKPSPPTPHRGLGGGLGEGGGPLRKIPRPSPKNPFLHSSPEVAYALEFVSQRRAWAHVLEEAKARGRLSLRPIHGDPKVKNVMMDTATGQAVSLVDLDTVKPGLVHYDLGDCLRSGCNPLGEETAYWETVRFDPDLCRAILKGYLSLARDFLTESDYAYLYDAIRLITFELGLRFFTDYLAGNVYFKARHRGHNLARALVQFKLTESIESQERAIRAIIQDEKMLSQAG